MGSVIEMSSNTAAWINAAKAHPLEVKNAPTYTPGPNEVLIRNRAVAINHIDCMIQKTAFHPMNYPAILGQDVAGEIAAVGSGVARFKEGDRVLGHAILYATQQNRDGGFQQYTIVRANLASELPDEISFEAACAVPVGLSTAACGLFQDADLGLQLPGTAPTPTNKTVLIWGGSSSVGSNAIQLTVAAGYEVITTASPHNFDFVRKLGASQVFDYQSPDIADELVRALAGKTLAGAYDAIGFAAATATANVVQQCEGSKRVSTTLPVLPHMVIPAGVTVKHVRGDELRDNHIAKVIYEDFLPKALKSRTFVPAPEPLVVGQGLEKVQDAIDLLHQRVSAKKLVVMV